MSRLINHTVRAGASAVGVAAGLMFLASTSQTPDGFTQASFNGPLGIFGGSDPEHQGDVMAIGDGTGDTSELAAILNRPVPVGKTAEPFREAFNAGIGPSSVGVGTVPTADLTPGAPTSKQSLSIPTKSVVDSHGRIDCTGSVSCLTDPSTHVTTVTYPDGVVALVQQINDMTVVAYKTVADALIPDQVQALFPTATAPVQRPLPAAAAPVRVDTPLTDAPEAEPAPSTAAVAPDISASTVRPRVDGAPTPQELAPGQNRGPAQSGSLTIPAVKPTSPFDVVKDAIDSVVNAVTGHQASQTKKPTDKTPTPSPTSDPTPDSATDSANQASTGGSNQ